MDLQAYIFPVDFSTASRMVPNCPRPRTFPSVYRVVTSCSSSDTRGHKRRGYSALSLRLAPGSPPWFFPARCSVAWLWSGSVALVPPAAQRKAPHTETQGYDPGSRESTFPTQHTLADGDEETQSLSDCVYRVEGPSRNDDGVESGNEHAYFPPWRLCLHLRRLLSSPP